MTGGDHDSVIPAQVSYLAIYNPTLGPTDETIADQIVYYTSQATHQRESTGSTESSEESKDLENERLRQIGLAQGLVNFASNFSDGKSLEYVETDKSRVILLELEKNWWIVASIDLTRLPADNAQKSVSEEHTPVFQYSSREMTPPPLLIQQLRRAHSTFLLHHNFTLDELLNQVGRTKLCLFLDRFWDKFTWNWELLLTGNPIVEIYNGIKLSAGGELGIGVGEEEWGSGEREVLEDFVTRTEGLVDLIVSRFGDPSPPFEEPSHSTDSDQSPWLGSDNHPRPSDGVVFTGIGALSRHSLAHVSHWMESIYRFGDAAYGVGRDPGSLRRRKVRKPRGRQSSENASQQLSPDRSFTPGIPRPLIMATPEPVQEAPGADHTGVRNEASPLRHEQQNDSMSFPTETVMKYLTLGYGSSWSFSPRSPAISPPNSSDPAGDDSHSTPTQDRPSNTAQSPPVDSNHRSDPNPKYLGRFVLGPRDDLQTLDDLEEGSPEPESENGKPKTRIVRRTLYLHLGGADAAPKELQAVIYVHQPFMFTFLFDPETSCLSSPSLYSSMHHQLGPLQKPLLSSTSPTMAASRVSMSESSDPSKRFSARTHSIYDLVYDPSNLTIRSSIPNIPSLSISLQPQPNLPSSSSPWSRVESLTIHHRLLSTHTDTRARPQELERTSKTNRGWWVVWVRIPQKSLSTASSSAALSSIADDPFAPPQAPLAPQEAFIVRKASDYVSPTGHGRVSSSARFFRDLGGASAGLTYRADTAPSKLVEGLGMDARRYIEGLLSLNR
ncbi:uncharacterized protein MYU51_009781 [Penicillium brevicompactum]|uniref:uncharacterized protein n=1 Tax=Penicillium brevicompactum TaxID=5074 RepID=UPI002541CA73|nr:uncharacterized protein N7506_001018 [Penicillium brevicompactum]KAJ5347765.1 hypothetical protein N7506_001018 [Penicillium brevicompactum]